jgi:RNA polymerase sigma factor (sigma-70 family)
MRFNLKEMQALTLTPELIAACKVGDRKAQEQLYKLYAKKMYAICMRYANDIMEAEDILMVGFTKVFTKIDSYQGQGSFEGWIRSIIVNSALSNYYKNLRRVKTTSFDSVPYLKEIVVSEQKSDVDYLLKALQSLPKQYKQAFNMFVLEGYSHREIGKLLDISESLSKVHVSRARKLLQDNLNKIAMRIDRTCYAA